LPKWQKKSSFTLVLKAKNKWGPSGTWVKSQSILFRWRRKKRDSSLFFHITQFLIMENKKKKGEL